MMTPGRIAIAHRQAALEHSTAQQLARESRCPVQEQVFHRSAIYHGRAYHRSVTEAQQLAVARNLRLGGTGGQLPANYHGDSQISAPRR
ncbi:MAG: hypothetical protein IPL39_14560 [Opitutaceae bacterium]|nr:hypothetical protein [Opitutaceae bacterium]